MHSFSLTTITNIEDDMFSIREKREIAEQVQRILRNTNHPELPAGEIYFTLHVDGEDPTWSWADIRNNGAVTTPSVNPHNEAMDSQHKGESNE